MTLPPVHMFTMSNDPSSCTHVHKWSSLLYTVVPSKWYTPGMKTRIQSFFAISQLKKPIDTRIVHRYRYLFYPESSFAMTHIFNWTKNMFEWSCRYGCIQGNLQQIKKEHVVFIFENFLRLTARMPINIFDDLQILFVKPKNFHEITPPQQAFSIIVW